MDMPARGSFIRIEFGSSLTETLTETSLGRSCWKSWVKMRHCRYGRYCKKAKWQCVFHSICDYSAETFTLPAS